MRLYATVTSERATKGQGGNKSLGIDILVYDRQNPRYHIEITPDSLIFTERGYSQPLLERSHKDIRLQEEAIKGEKQKGEWKDPRKCVHGKSLFYENCEPCGYDTQKGLTK